MRRGRERHVRRCRGSHRDARALIVHGRGRRVEQREPLRNRLRPLFRLDRHAGVDRLTEPRREARMRLRRQGLAETAVQAFQHLGRLLSRDALVHHYSQCIDVRPRALGVGLHVLFEGGVGRGVEGDLGVGRLTGFEARRAEIDQHRPARRVDQNNGGLDVAMHHAAFERAVEAHRHRTDQRHQARFVEAFAVVQHLRQRCSVLVVHHHVRRAVDLEQAAYADDVRVPLGLGEVPEDLGLFQELLAAEGKDFLRRRVRRLHRFAVDAVADGAGEILLDRDQFVEIGPAPLVDDAEAAHAQHLLQAPFAQHRAFGQRAVRIRLVHSRSPRLHP